MNKLFQLSLICLTLFLQAQQTDVVDFKSVTAQLSINPKNQSISGILNVDFKILKLTDSIFIDAVAMKFQKVNLNGLPISFANDGKKLWLKHRFEADKNYELCFEYEAFPKKALYFIDWSFDDGNRQIWTQGQGKNTSQWLPSIDDVNDKMVFHLAIEFDKHFNVIANGKLINKQINATTTTWHYAMQQPMSSYLVAFAIGTYHKKTEISKRGIPLEMYYYPDPDSYRDLKFEPTYRYTKRLFDFLEAEIGVPYPWQNYKQVPVKDFLYAGMENTTTTIFSDSFLIDSIAFIDKNYVNVNAHELAHQWFGNLVTAISGNHQWLQEGFATYYALLAEKDIFGNDYYYGRLYEYAQELLEQDKVGKSTALLNPKSSSTTFYKKGALVLHVLREQVGDKAFKKAVKNYLLKHQFSHVETNDFIFEVEKASGKRLSEFVKTWLESPVFQYQSVVESLEKSKFIKRYIALNCEQQVFKCEKKLASNVSEAEKIKMIHQNPNLITKATFKNTLKVRQAITENLIKIPLNLKANYETLLNDASYITIEQALFNLWQNFPQERNTYLEKTKSVTGFNDKNIRTLWLTLALLTENYEPENKHRYFDELTKYTNPSYSFEIRQHAFSYLHEINACNDICVKNLKQATLHPNWQFSKFAKGLLNPTN